MQPTMSQPTTSPGLDPLGMPGAPQETLNVLKTRFEGSEWAGGQVILVTDRQGERPRAGYGAVVLPSTDPGGAVVFAPAFGPRYGESGASALADLVAWATERDLPLRETVLPAGDFQRVLAEPDLREIRALIAASNPTDPGIYTQRFHEEVRWE